MAATKNKQDEVWLVYINKKTKKMEMRELHKEPTDTSNEEFMQIVPFVGAATICNRYNNMQAQCVLKEGGTCK